MTMKEIALQAGVSVSTVSRIINSPDGSFARKEVRDRVWAIIEQTGYSPNQNAKNLKSKNGTASSISKGTITCILGRTEKLEENPFFDQVSQAIKRQALELGYTVSLTYSIFDTELYQKGRCILSSPADGAIILGRFNKQAAKLLEEHYKNLLFVGRNQMDVPWDQVLCDGYEATQIALGHLLEQGHQRIAYIGETRNEIRFQAYLDFLNTQGFKQEQEIIAACKQNDGDGGYRGADILLSQVSLLPTAVFCATDVAAIAALRCFRKAKIKVPDTLSLISMDNIELSGYVSPMLTTVEMPIVEIGNVAVQTLINRMEKKHKLPLIIKLPNKLVVRESVCNLNEGIYI